MCAARVCKPSCHNPCLLLGEGKSHDAEIRRIAKKLGIEGPCTIEDICKEIDSKIERATSMETQAAKLAHRVVEYFGTGPIEGNLDCDEETRFFAYETLFLIYGKKIFG